MVWVQNLVGPATALESGCNSLYPYDCTNSLCFAFSGQNWCSDSFSEQGIVVFQVHERSGIVEYVPGGAWRCSSVHGQANGQTNFDLCLKAQKPNLARKVMSRVAPASLNRVISTQIKLDPFDSPYQVKAEFLC